MWALVICFFTCLGCIAYLMDELKDVQHRCSKVRAFSFVNYHHLDVVSLTDRMLQCGTLLATWHRGGSTMVHVHPQA
jgi:hypothetical protein